MLLSKRNHATLSLYTMGIPNYWGRIGTSMYLSINNFKGVQDLIQSINMRKWPTLDFLQHAFLCLFIHALNYMHIETVPTPYNSKSN